MCIRDRAYADDITLIGRNVCILKEVFGEIDREKRKMSLKVNSSKTKCMKIATEILKFISFT